MGLRARLGLATVTRAVPRAITTTPTPPTTNPVTGLTTLCIPPTRQGADLGGRTAAAVEGRPVRTCNACKRRCAGVKGWPTSDRVQAAPAPCFPPALGPTSTPLATPRAGAGLLLGCC